MKRSTLLLIFVLSSFIFLAQQKSKDWYLIEKSALDSISVSDKTVLDSLLPLYHQSKSDSVKLLYLHKIVEATVDENIWPKYNDLMLELSKDKKGSVYVKYHAAAINNIGLIAFNKGNTALAIKSYLNALDLRKSISDKSGMQESYHNIGNLYRGSGELDKGLEYLLKALDLEKSMNDRLIIPATLNTIGQIYYQQGKYEKALDYIDQSLTYAVQDKNKGFLASAYISLGDVYSKLKNPEKAIDSYDHSIQLSEDIGDKIKLSSAFIGLSSLYLDQKNYPEAERYSKLAMKTGRELGFPRIIQNASSLLYKVLKNENKYQEALQMYEQYVKMKDSTSSKEQAKMFAAIEFNAREAQMKAESDKETAIAKAETSRQKTISWSMSGILGLMILLAVIVFIGYTEKKKAHVLISRQKAEVEQSRREIVDSINYAKRIQLALFKEEEHVSMHLPPHFILFKPKDIVSGDFYWAIEKGEYFYFAAGDCTGHGVPGAFLTMLGISVLNEINACEKQLTPAEILNELRNHIVKELGNQGQTKDGMDISLIRFNLVTKEFMWAGAYNPLWYVRNKELFEVKADKQPIGYTENPKPFTNHLLNLLPDDTIYLFTDGFADQFGGAQGKKFKYKQLSNLLQSLSHLPMEDQKERCIEQFENWKGNLEQVDDVIIIGMKI